MINQTITTNLKINSQQFLDMKLLQFGVTQLAEYLEELELSNPLLKINYKPYKSRETLMSFEELDRLNSEESFIDTLSFSLFEQLDKTSLSIEDKKIAKSLIGLLDEHGFLCFEIEELAKLLKVKEEKIKEIIKVLQGFEPSGIFAKDISNSLVIQLVKKKIGFPTLNIVKEHLDDISKHHYSLIAKTLKIAEKEVIQSEKIIKSLNPYPFVENQEYKSSYYIYPDVTISEKNGRLYISKYDNLLPICAVDDENVALLKGSKDVDNIMYLNERKKEVQMLKNALEYRKSVLIRCIEKVIDIQKDYFYRTELKKYTMTQLANELGISKSSVSRAVKDKYIQSKYGTVEFKALFNRKLYQVKERLISLILSEDKNKPFSDNEISKKLEIPRRTIAKYRKELHIPESYGRKVRE